MWTKLSAFILRNRFLILSVVILLTAGFAYYSQKVGMSYKMAEVLPKNDETYQDYEKFRSIFGEEANVIVIALKEKEFFNQKLIQSWNDLEEKIKSIKNVDWTLSPVSCSTLIRDDSLKKFTYQPLFQSLPENQSAADSIKEIFHQLPFYRNILFNPETHTYVMIAGLNKGIIHKKERLEVVTYIQDEIHRFEQKESKDLHISGLPFIRSDTIKRSKKEIVLFTIMAAIMASVILLIFFKSARILIIALSQVGISVIWSSGTMGIFGYQINILTGLIPPLLIVIGIPNAVYLITKYQQEYLKSGDKHKAISRMIQKTGRALLLTNITTAIGFGTLVLTNSKILVEFGIISSINILFLFIISLLWIPIHLSFLPNLKKRHTSHLTNKRSNFFIDLLLKLSLQYRNQVYILTFVVFIFSLVGMYQIESSGKIADEVPQHSETYSDLAFFENNFNGVMPFEIMIDTRKEKKARLSQKLWKKVDQLQDSIALNHKFSRPVSFIDLIKYCNQAYYRGNQNEYRIPNQLDLPRIQQFIGKSNENNKDSLLSSYIDTSSRYIRVRAQMKDMGTYEIEDLINKIDHQAREIFKEEDVDITITGASVVILKGTKYLLKNLIMSLTVAIVMIAFIMGLMFRKLKMVIISLVPNILPLLFTAGIMGYFGIPLKASTCIIFSIAFGISVDDTIHFLAKYRQELKHFNGNIKESVLVSIKETGLSMAYTSIILFFGFSVFIASDFGGTKALGILISMTLIIAMLSNLTLLPSLLLTLHKKQIDKDYKLYSVIEEDDEETDKSEEKA